MAQQSTTWLGRWRAIAVRTLGGVRVAHQIWRSWRGARLRLITNSAGQSYVQFRPRRPRRDVVPRATWSQAMRPTGRRRSRDGTMRGRCAERAANGTWRSCESFWHSKQCGGVMKSRASRPRRTGKPAVPPHLRVLRVGSMAAPGSDPLVGRDAPRPRAAPASMSRAPPRDVTSESATAPMATVNTAAIAGAG